jgi:hypothetical protein
VEKLGDYYFKLEFIEKEKRRVIEGDPGATKGML